MEDETKLVQALDIINSAFCPVQDISSADDMRTSLELVNLMLSFGVDIGADALSNLLVESGFKREYLGGDFFWLIRRK